MPQTLHRIAGAFHQSVLLLRHSFVLEGLAMGIVLLRPLICRP